MDEHSRLWEYTAEQPELPPDGTTTIGDRQITDWLNKMASKGWEFVGMGNKWWHNDHVPQQWWIFRRRKRP